MEFERITILPIQNYSKLLIQNYPKFRIETFLYAIKKWTIFRVYSFSFNYINLLLDWCESFTQILQGHYDDVIWTSCGLKSPVIRLFLLLLLLLLLFYSLCEPTSKKYHSPYFWPFVGGNSTVDSQQRCISQQRASNAEKSFNWMPISWLLYWHSSDRKIYALSEE